MRLDVMRRNTSAAGPSRPAPTYSPLSALLAAVTILVGIPLALVAVANPVAAVVAVALVVAAHRLAGTVRRRRSGRRRTARRVCLPATDRCVEV